MQFDKIHNKGQARIFENGFLEMLTKAHPILIWGIYTPVIVYSLYYSHIHLGFSIIKMAFLFLGGAFFWTFFEYISHRYIFHLKANSKTSKRIVYIMHGNHHHYPRDTQRLFMPPIPSLIISSTIALVFYLILGHVAFAFFPGFIFGYLIYGSMHYAIHAWSPPFKWMKPLWRNHHLHHYKNVEKGFGVSSTFWDLIFGTMFDLSKEDKEK